MNLPKTKKIMIGAAVCLMAITLLSSLTFMISSEKKEKKIIPSRFLSGIYELPADGAMSCQTIRGEKLIFRAGEPVRFEQLENPDVFQVANDNIPFLEISRRTYTTGPALTGGPLCLKASEGKKVLVRAVILD